MASGAHRVEHGITLWRDCRSGTDRTTPRASNLEPPSTGRSKDQTGEGEPRADGRVRLWTRSRRSNQPSLNLTRFENAPRNEKCLKSSLKAVERRGVEFNTN